MDLAIRLVEFNSSPDIIVSTLLKIGNLNKAIRVAVDSNESHLIYSVIIYMKNNLTQEEFLLRLCSNQYLNALGINYLREFDQNLLLSLYKQEDKIKNLASYKLIQIFNKTISQQKDVLKEISELTKQKGILKNTCLSYINLLESQSNLEKQFSQKIKLIGLSLIATIITLCEFGHVQEATKIKNDFFIPDSRFYWSAVTSLAKSGLWSKIDSLYETKKNAFSLTVIHTLIYISPTVTSTLNKKHLYESSKNLYSNYRLIVKFLFI
uniref:Vacuolar protein sorting-associated protein 16 homolog (Trinotate prediction) n=1 Tax=Henneguya salminicola TaxID=69463 RepID=A0A6G3MFC8_HENSL